MNDDRAVFEALRAGDLDVLRDVYARWSPLVHTLALRSLDDVDLAEQVTTRVFLDLPASPEPAEARPTTVARRLVDLACRRIRETTPVDESNLALLAEGLVAADALAHLDAVDRRVLTMVLEGAGPEDVAGRTGLSVEEVRRRVARGLTELDERREEQADARRR